MMTFNTEKLRAPHIIFFIYVVIFSLLIMIFKFIFPGSETPLIIYSRNWRLIQGLLEVFNLFPALALSALVIPFGFGAYEEKFKSFSEVFFKRILPSVITAIGAAVIYGIIFFFALPMLKGHEENLRFTGSLYQLAKRNAHNSRDAGDWFEASQFINICDRIWYNSPELSALRDEIAINLGGQAFGERNLTRGSTTGRRFNEVFPLSEDQQPVDAAQAIELSAIALNEERYFDAHWLANLGERLAVRGSAQAAFALQLSSQAWNLIASQAPNLRETRLYELYNLKLSGYQAMETGDWIRAFYIFQELLILTPNDPDVPKFHAASEQGAKEMAFFIDEMELSTGEILNGAVFSLVSADGRAVLRFSSLTLSSDIAYGFGFDYMDFDANMNLRSSGTARYVKLVPVTFTAPNIHILTHALDRSNEDNFFQGEWVIGSEPLGGILLDISFEDFLLLAKTRRGLPNLQINELFVAANDLEKAGYVSQIFQAEILNRFSSAFFFLPMSIFIIVIAWRYRAHQRPRYLFFLLLPVLPVIFYGFNFIYRTFLNTIGIWLVISIGFVPALVVCFFTLVAALLVSLIVLSAQRS